MMRALVVRTAQISQRYRYAAGRMLRTLGYVDVGSGETIGRQEARIHAYIVLRKS